MRITPRCPVFGRCGGCQWQHLPYSLQWQTKARGVRHALDRVQGIYPAPEAWIELPAEQIWEYRNRVQLRGVGDKVGFYSAGSRDLVSVDRCDIARSEINGVLPEIRAEGARRDRPYKVEVEVFPGGEVRKFWNARHAAGGFRQVHDAQNEKMRRFVRDTLSPGRRLIDLFGGSGNLSAPLADRMSAIHCVDVSAPRERPADAPANLAFYRADVLFWLLKKAIPPGIPTSAIIDPPREGLGSGFGEIAPALEALGVDEIVAVGCDPDAWARDLSRWIRRDWRIEKIAVVDLFPQTPHVESIALLRL
jgi:tRNA/tmRNA/rRNA uracil-C5-methylase (TrmA/RlmC/RlmD family)